VRALSLFLKVAAPVFFIVGAMHLTLGLNADVLLGARLPAEVLSDPTLDSQNRFYGVAFTLYGAMLYLSATDLRKYATVLRCVLWVFFAAGVARFVSIAIYGVPPVPVVVLLGSEVVAPPVLLVWLSRVLREG
jgi:hypothetical protein